MITARFFAVADPINAGEICFWRLRDATVDGPVEPGHVEPWPRKSAWGVVRRSEVPAAVLADRDALEKYLDDLEGRALRTVAGAINDDPEGAARLFAINTGRCFCCGKGLTDARSRAIGIGPDCRRVLAPETLAAIGAGR